MTTAGEKIASADEAFCGNIGSLTDERALLPRNVLAHLRNLVEGAAVRLHRQLRIRALLDSECGISVLANLDSFPIDLDASLSEYHLRIAEAVDSHRQQPSDDAHRGRYYIHRTRPFFVHDANEDDITHSIFYTAVTRAREQLRIFWTPETQQAVLGNLRRDKSRKDVAILSSRRDLRTVAGPAGGR